MKLKTELPAAEAKRLVTADRRRRQVRRARRQIEGVAVPVQDQQRRAEARQHRLALGTDAARPGPSRPRAPARARRSVRAGCSDRRGRRRRRPAAATPRQMPSTGASRATQLARAARSPAPGTASARSPTSPTPIGPPMTIRISSAREIVGDRLAGVDARGRRRRRRARPAERHPLRPFGRRVLKDDRASGAHAPYLGPSGRRRLDQNLPAAVGVRRTGPSPRAGAASPTPSP